VSKTLDVIETELLCRVRDKSGGEPAYGPDGDRHKGGARPVHGSCAERGNLPSEVKGELQVADPLGAEYRCGRKGRTGW